MFFQKMLENRIKITQKRVFIGGVVKWVEKEAQKARKTAQKRGSLEKGVKNRFSNGKSPKWGFWG